jgi:hypothetical protein
MPKPPNAMRDKTTLAELIEKEPLLLLRRPRAVPDIPRTCVTYSSCQSFMIPATYGSSNDEIGVLCREHRSLWQQKA